jgi:dTDP-4-dehydrorhamnose 3,5-epimerase
MHFQVEPFMEAKTVSCLKGSIYDVAVDLRRDSPTYGQYEAVRLTSSPRQAFHIPKGFAHGFLTLEPETEVLYLMSEFYQPDSARGFRWDDPRFAIAWPGPPAVISDRDRNYPDFLDI